jgi:hypothetical protein
MYIRHHTRAVLIELFEEAVTKYNDLNLKEKILEHFDNKLRS